MIFQLWEVVDILHIQQGSELTLTLCLTKGKVVKLKTTAQKKFKYTICHDFFPFTLCKIKCLNTALAIFATEQVISFRMKIPKQSQLLKPLSAQ